ncbi:MAG: hypothetical protein A3J28_02295 [Acidobacteria bacterium RIFCSPLOWO2_12_FULL_60_22]|nr:MAG: hypothetical protein A3J28_02295 [Acidobacteria bacterium RIFCSPLOWO2_12_FULL_60_22]
MQRVFGRASRQAGMPKWAAVIVITTLPKAVAQRQRSDKNQIFALLPVLKPTFKMALRLRLRAGLRQYGRDHLTLALRHG